MAADTITIFELHAPVVLRDAIRKGEDFSDYEIKIPGQEGKFILRVLPWGKFNGIDLPEGDIHRHTEREVHDHIQEER